MLPYIELKPWIWLPAGSLGGLVPMDVGLQPFGLLSALGMGLGVYLCARQAVSLGMSRARMLDFSVWILVGGVVGAHLLEVGAYRPRAVLDDPWLLLRLWDGMSSWGGFLGGVLAAILWGKQRGAVVMPYADLVASVLPLALMFGRAGCAVSHDHPGVRSDSLLAMPFPDGSRLDMGFIEMLLLVPLAGSFLWLRRRRRPWGFFGAWFCVGYAPLRFVLDFFRAEQGPLGDVRYAGLTPAQWLCLISLPVGAIWLSKLRTRRQQPEAFAIPGARRGSGSKNVTPSKT